MATGPNQYGKGYLKFDGGTAMEVLGWKVDFTDGGEDQFTLARGWAGRAGGNAKTSVTFHGVLPTVSADGGSGTTSGGMVTGKGIAIDATLLNNQNGNNNLPIRFTGTLGSNPDAPFQAVSASGYISDLSFEVDEKTVKFSGTLSASPTKWGNP
jgi:hypothetical protein